VSKVVTFYHSVICPRCRMTSLFLGSLLAEYPDVTVERVEYLANLNSAREAGVRSIPTLVAGDMQLSGFLISRSRLRRFLERVTAR
jgi:predicted DsbA family dithiol-disulfide isomerase